MTPHKKNVLTWYILIYHVIGFETNSWHQKRYSEGSKKFVGVAVYWEE